MKHIKNKPTNPIFFDTHKAYELSNGEIVLCDKIPKRACIISLPPTELIYTRLEVDTLALQSAGASLLISLAPLKAPSYAYELYFTAYPHLFDEQKCVCECFFFAKSRALPHAAIITSDIFLPLCAFAANAHKSQNAFVAWIESYLCYFEHNALREICVLDMADSMLQERVQGHIAYLQDAYGQVFKQIYYFMPSLPHQFIESTPHAPSQDVHTNSVDSIESEAKNVQGLSFVPFYECFGFKGEIDFEHFRAFLAFEYAKMYENTKVSLPNFAPKPSPYKRLYAGIAAAFVLFVCLIPLGLASYNHYLHNVIISLNEQTQQLFMPDDALQGAQEGNNEKTPNAHTSTLSELTKKQHMLLENLQEVHTWQQSYIKRYEFMQSILSQCNVAHISVEGIAFYFTPQIFIATMQVSSSSQMHLSSLLATLNNGTQSALFNPPDSINKAQEGAIESAPDTPDKTKAQIMVVHYVI